MTPTWARHAQVSAVVGASCFAGGWLAHRPPPAEKTVAATSSHAAAREASSSSFTGTFRMVDAVAPREVVKWKRWPVVLPSPGCPLAYAEEGESTVSADRRVVNEAVAIAAAKAEKGSDSDAASFSSRTAEASTERRLTLGLGLLADPRAAAGGEAKWSAVAIAGIRIVGPFGVAISGSWGPGESAKAGGWLTWQP